MTDGSPASAAAQLSNVRIAELLEEVAELLEAQHAHVFRVRAWRLAADTIANLDEPVAAIIERDGLIGLIHLPKVGVSLARAIEQLALTRRLGLLERLRGQTSPEELFTTVPGLGHELAERIHHELGLESLHDLEAAAWDGRLARVPGLGERRIRAVRESLAGRFRPHGSHPIHVHHSGDDEPLVAEILSVDDEYRRKVEADRLPRIAPKRLNPSGEAWLPILHCGRGERHYTALYSNTARAHAMGTTHDWVVIYRDDHGGHGQWTVVTSRYPPLAGKRIVRGREPECRSYYQIADHRPSS